MRLSVTGASSLSLFAYRAAAALAAFSANLYLASVLGPEEFGRYALALALLTFSSFFMDFGYFASGATLLAETQDQDLRRGYAGALIVLGAATSMLFVGIVIALGLIVDLIFPDQVGSLLVVTALAAPALVTPLFVDQILKASARVHLLGAWQALPRATLSRRDCGRRCARAAQCARRPCVVSAGGDRGRGHRAGGGASAGEGATSTTW